MSPNQLENREPVTRRFRKLRLSITSRCNFACTYCTPEDGEKASEKSVDPVHLTDMVRSIHNQSPLESIRITGGEPLLYRHLPVLIRLLKEVGIPTVSITTNGALLYDRIACLHEEGLDSLNLSLDTLDPEGFRRLSRTGNLEKVLKGLDRALVRGIPVKLNATVVRGENHQQVIPLLEFARMRNLEIRFIELMEMGHLHGSAASRIYPMEEILTDIRNHFEIAELPRHAGSTAMRWSYKGDGIFGIIPNASKPFCHDCDRLRMTADGKLFGCLSNPEGLYLEPDHGEREVAYLLEQAMGQKRLDRFVGSSLSMRSIGG